MERLQVDTLYKACLILFGPDIAANRGFLSYLQLSGVKSAYRQRALLTHPDRVITMEDAAREKSADLFIETNWAYKQLSQFINDRDSDKSSVCFRPVGDTCNPSGKSREAAYQQMRFYSGAFPRRTLMFAEYLYYSGKVPWKALVEAIVWQRRQRPRFGETAKRWKYLSDDEILWLISRRAFCEPIGETSVRLNVLSKIQVNTVLMHQRLQQRRIGEYFVEQGYLSRDILSEIFMNFKKHNSRHLSRKIR